MTTAPDSPVRAALMVLFAAVTWLAALPALATSAAPDEAPRQARHAAQTADATVWSEPCEPGYRTPGSRPAMRRASPARAASRPGARANYFMLCNVAIKTSYE